MWASLTLCIGSCLMVILASVEVVLKEEGGARLRDMDLKKQLEPWVSRAIIGTACVRGGMSDPLD